jgi:hypothetical protein
MFSFVCLLFAFFDISSDGLHMAMIGGRVLYFHISEYLHTHDPRLVCLACGPAVGGHVHLKQLLAHSFSVLMMN